MFTIEILAVWGKLFGRGFESLQVHGGAHESQIAQNFVQESESTYSVRKADIKPEVPNTQSYMSAIRAWLGLDGQQK